MLDFFELVWMETESLNVQRESQKDIAYTGYCKQGTLIAAVRGANAGAESFNSKIKGFRALLRGVPDLPFFMFGLCAIFG